MCRYFSALDPLRVVTVFTERILYSALHITVLFYSAKLST